MRFLEGVSVAAGIEFRQRIRASGWRWLLLAWFSVMALITLLMWLAVRAEHQDTGTKMFGYLMFLTLGLLLLVAPALTGQSVNGDRERGTLATLQVSRLSPIEITLGKLLAAWSTGIVFLLLLIPMVVACMAAGGVPFSNVVVVYMIQVSMIGVVCSISLALSSLFNRSTTSTVMSYLSVFALLVGTAVVFLLVSSFVKTTRQVRDTSASWFEGARAATYPQTESRTDLLWPLLAPNPAVILADATPAQKIPECDTYGADDWYACDISVDPLRSLGDSARSLRDDPFDDGDDHSEPSKGKAVWPLGLTVDVALGVAALALTSRRLRTPAVKLPKGQRIA